MTETDPSTLTQFRGRPVPWVTRWTGQVYDTTQHEYQAKLVKTPNGRPAFTYRDRLEFRDNHGVLWLKEGAGRPGEPQWKMVSTYRQRMCMVRTVCQVCGNKIEEKTGSNQIPWLVDALEWEAFEEAHEKGAPILTVTTPVCPDCIGLATRLCPQLVKGYRLLRVELYELWGVHGETVLNGRKVLGAVGYDEPYRLPVTIARQQMVELVSYTEVEEWA